MELKTVGLRLVLVFLVAVVSGRQPLSDTATAVCEKVGDSSGCSGCSSGQVACEWCVSPNNDADGGCYPDGYCASFEDSDGEPLVGASHLCPLDPKTEPHYQGSQLNSGEGAREIEGIFSSYFDSHYCEFPVQPWPIDRSANPLGDNDPASGCLFVNKLTPSTGQRLALEECLFGDTGPKKRDLNAQPRNTLTLKRTECLRVFNSYACTVACPAYGTAADFTGVCHDYCERLEQICDDEMLDCMESVGFDLREHFECALKGETKCFSPTLIQTSGKFERDLCFYGDSSLCDTLDCVVELAVGDTWPTYFQDEDYWSRSNGDNFNPAQLGPGCDYHNDWYFADRVPSAHSGLLYRIVALPQGDGLSCEIATRLAARRDFGSQVATPQNGVCTPSTFVTTTRYCALSLSLYLGSVPLPEGVQDPSKVYNCPAVINDNF